MLRSTSVVMTTIGASALRAVSPVSRPTLVGAVAGRELGVLLVRQRLDRRRVEAFAAGCAAPGRRRTRRRRSCRRRWARRPARCALGQRQTGPLLERVEPEREASAANAATSAATLPRSAHGPSGYVPVTSLGARAPAPTRSGDVVLAPSRHRPMRGGRLDRARAAPRLRRPARARPRCRPARRTRTSRRPARAPPVVPLREQDRRPRRTGTAATASAGMVNGS